MQSFQILICYSLFYSLLETVIKTIRYRSCFHGVRKKLKKVPPLEGGHLSKNCQRESCKTPPALPIPPISISSSCIEKKWEWVKDFRRRDLQWTPYCVGGCGRGFLLIYLAKMENFYETVHDSTVQTSPCTPNVMHKYVYNDEIGERWRQLTKKKSGLYL